MMQKVPQNFNPLSDYIGNNSFTNPLPLLFQLDDEKEKEKEKNKNKDEDSASSDISSSSGSVKREMQLLKSRVEKLEKVVVTNQLGTIHMIPMCIYTYIHAHNIYPCIFIFKSAYINKNSPIR